MEPRKMLYPINTSELMNSAFTKTSGFNESNTGFVASGTYTVHDISGIDLAAIQETVNGYVDKIPKDTRHLVKTINAILSLAINSWEVVICYRAVLFKLCQALFCDDKTDNTYILSPLLDGRQDSVNGTPFVCYSPSKEDMTLSLNIQSSGINVFDYIESQHVQNFCHQKISTRSDECYDVSVGKILVHESNARRFASTVDDKLKRMFIGELYWEEVNIVPYSDTKTPEMENDIVLGQQMVHVMKTIIAQQGPKVQYLH